jgi:hypothetical protein
MRKKIKNKKIVLTFIFAIFLVVGFGLAHVEKASADNGNQCKCYARGGFSSYSTVGGENTMATEADCTSSCQKLGVNYYKYGSHDYVNSTGLLDSVSTISLPKALTQTKPEPGYVDVCQGMSWLNPISSVVNCLLLYVLKLLTNLLEAVTTLFNYIIQPKNFTDVVGNKIIYEMWAFVRDILNVAFILTLLFSAFCTVFQISKYSYKSLLITLIIMALLVNFSFPIARVIIDFSNVIMYYFINNLGMDSKTSNAIFTNIARDSALGKIIYQDSVKTDTSYLMASVIFTFMFTVTLLIVAILFVIRMIVLAILVIFSSVAFVGSIVPFLSSQASKWWDMLFKYAFFGPLMIFMIVVATKMMAAIADHQGRMAQIATSNKASDPTTIAAMAFFAIPIVILWVGLGTAQSMSIFGAGAVVGRGQKFMGWAGKTLTGYRAAKWGGKTLAKKAERGLAKGKYTWWASPTAFKEAWKERTAEAERKAFKPATGAWRDKLNSVFSLGKDKTRFKDAAIQNNIATRQKELEATSTNSEYLMNEFERAEKSKDTEKMAAILRIMFNNNDQNEFMKLSGKEVHPFEMKQEVYARLKKAGMEEQEIFKQMSDLSEIAIGKGNYANFGMAQFDPKTGSYRLNSDTEQVAASIGKASNIKAQTKTDLWHWNSFITQNADGSSGHIHEIGYEQLNNLTGSELKQLGRARTDFFKRLGGDPKIVKQIEDHAKSLSDPTKAAMVFEFARLAKGYAADPNFKP